MSSRVCGISRHQPKHDHKAGFDVPVVGGHRQRANRPERLEVSGSAPAVSEELRQRHAHVGALPPWFPFWFPFIAVQHSNFLSQTGRQAEHDAAAEAELEEVKRKAGQQVTFDEPRGMSCPAEAAERRAALKAWQR